MYRIAVSIVVLAVSAGLITVRCDAQIGQKQESKKNNSKTKSESASMIGCIDEDNGRYILISDRTRATVANLEAEGFPTEGFAKHVGHKVTVRGTSNPGTDVPLFRVRSVETISETCEPQLQQ
jgi:hypothetical protein